MKAYTSKPSKILELEDQKISSFMEKEAHNLDVRTVNSFGDEWSKFSSFTSEEIQQIGDEYFDIVPDAVLNKSSYTLDIGCGTGRWSVYAARRAAFVEAIDPSQAVYSAIALTKNIDNIRVSHAGVDEIPFDDETFDFVFSLGVFHHLPDTQKAIGQAAAKIKKGGYFLIYLYYSLDNRGPFFRLLFHLSNALRFFISKMPRLIKFFFCDLLAVLFYLPFVGFTRLVRKLNPSGEGYKKIPLFWYHDKTFKVIRNDSLDRFGTPLEQRFSKVEIGEMLAGAGFENFVFSDKAPYWHVLVQKK